ncbi:YdaS family helix-turn-helix protein [uncultured Salinicola sp.]|uniref:YdaS family helix-turn-helix protein n=1 Tax=uncultured Salinicola sp. TaxID=1193542 RepID=UPI00263034A6|nr:YdaS family helix-turn-helix protein [uncultured Salinicola sp.]
MSAIRLAVEQLGGVSRCARVCGVSPSAVCKWLRRERLPRTEYTGETCHALRMAAASEGAFTAAWLLANAGPATPLAADGGTSSVGDLPGAEDPVEQTDARQARPGTSMTP